MQSTFAKYDPDLMVRPAFNHAKASAMAAAQVVRGGPVRGVSVWTSDEGAGSGSQRGWMKCSMQRVSRHSAPHTPYQHLIVS